MRIDLLLKYLCLTKSRSSAKNLCDKGSVLVNGKAVRPSAMAKVGDRITVNKRGGTLEIRILQLPDRQVSRAAAPECYERISWISNRDADLDF
jgi:ribosomal 50S subunit-recycling heat shock protein